MNSKPLIETNPHLRDPVGYRKALFTNVSNSTAIETGKRIDEVATSLQTAFPSTWIKQVGSEPSR